MAQQVTQIVLTREDFNAELDARDNRVFERLLAILGGHKSGPNYHTRKATAQKLGVTLPTLDAWTRQGKITSRRISGRVLYTDEDIESALPKVKTTIHATA